MKRILVMLVATLSLCVGLEAHARPHRHRVRHAAHVAKRRAKHAHHRARHVVTRDRTPRVQHPADELVLSPSLMRQLQQHLSDAGYFDGPTDGRLDARTRHGLAGFQRDYHLPGDGSLTRASAEALLGRDTIGAYTVAAAH